jgi:hypothetical protein
VTAVNLGNWRTHFSWAEPSLRDAFRAPMRGAEQRRRPGGLRLALSEPQASLASRPDCRVAQGTRAAGADPGVAFFFGYFLLADARRKYARPQGGTPLPNKPTQQFTDQHQETKPQKQESPQSPEAPSLKTTKPANYILSIIASPNPEQESSSAPGIKRAKS